MGLPLLLGRDATSRPRDPLSGAPIHIAVRAGAAHWDPPDAAVSYCDPRRTATGPDPCCGAIHFFAAAESAGEYLRTRVGATGRVLSPAAALAGARRQFGDLLAGEGPLDCRCR